MSDGATPEEALKNVEEAIVSWIEAATEWQQEIPRSAPPLASAG
jgi:predicted RNase H-like HicB family nuclease